MGKLWLNASNKIITDGSGKPIECSACPCGLPSGLYACGAFTQDGGANTFSRVAYYDGSSWFQLGTGLNNTAWDCCLYGSNLAVVGEFTTADGVTVSGCGIWDGTAWSALGIGLPSTGYCCAQSGSNLLVGTGGHSVQMWNGSTWSTMGTWPGTGHPGKIAVTAQGIFAADSNDFGIFKWNGTGWTVQSLNGYSGGSSSTQFGVVAGPSGDTISGLISLATNLGRNIQSFNGSAWTNIAPTGSNYPVFAQRIDSLGVEGSTIYVGVLALASAGQFTLLVAYNSGVWTSLDINVFDNTIFVIKPGASGIVYLGGSFSTPGGKVCSYNGSSFSSLGSSFNAEVYGLQYVP